MGEADRLARYRAMRDFARTPEPAGDEPPAEAAGRFVVQEHHATSMHWDLRLERDGTLASWAVPKGIPPDPRDDHLAVQTEDHPLEYLEFSGHIPEGEYGGGQMTIWDRGTYHCHKWDEREVMITLAGERASGRFVLFRTGDRQWMLHRMDPPVDPTREPMPSDVRPVVPAPGGLPPDPGAWSFEPSWGGVRVAVASEGGRARLVDAGGADHTETFPELRGLGRALGAVAVVLDGEVVVVGAGGRPDPEAPGRRARAKSDAARRRLAERAPAAFFAADVIWLEGHATTKLAYTQRRPLLERLEIEGPAWHTVPAHPGDGAALLAAGRASGLAGVVARRLDGGYDADSLRFIGE